MPQFQLAWVMGTPTFEEAFAKTKQFTLDGVVEKIRCPLLVVHGEDDQQVPLADAIKTFEAAMASRKELKVFTRAEGGSQHCQLDSRALGIDYIADWVADVLPGR